LFPARSQVIAMQPILSEEHPAQPDAEPLLFYFRSLPIPIEFSGITTVLQDVAQD
jgi:hypothetical protein